MTGVFVYRFYFYFTANEQNIGNKTQVCLWYYVTNCVSASIIAIANVANFHMFIKMDIDILVSLLKLCNW